MNTAQQKTNQLGMSNSNINSQEINTKSMKIAITELLENYFDGLYHCDTELLSQVFHPKAQYFCAVDNNFMHYTMPKYFDVVSKRQSPASLKQARNDEIVAIDIAGKETALAKVHCSIADRYFTDFLSLIFEQGQWWIISKVFHYDLIKC